MIFIVVTSRTMCINIRCEAKTGQFVNKQVLSINLLRNISNCRAWGVYCLGMIKTKNVVITNTLSLKVNAYKILQVSSSANKTAQYIFRKEINHLQIQRIQTSME